MSVFVCGSLHLDVIVAAPHLPRPDETVVGAGVSYAFGGKGGNQAVAAARMGAATAMAGRVGRDNFGARLLGELALAGVDHHQVRQADGASGMSVAIIDPAGDYGAVIVSGANLGIDPAEITVPADTHVLLLQNEIPEAVNIAIATQARAIGAQVILNAAPARAMGQGLLTRVDVLIVNAVEAADMLNLSDTALDPLTAAGSLADLGPRQVIITLGARGLVIFDGQSTLCPAHRVELVSSHGAGDAFIGALASQLDDGRPLWDACVFGQAAAALHVSTAVAGRSAINPHHVRAFAAARPR